MATAISRGRPRWSTPRSLCRRWRLTDRKVLRTRCAALADFPQMRKLGGDDALVGNVTGEYAGVARELVHAGNEAPRDRGIVIGEVPADELGDQLGLGRRKKLAAHLGRARDILLQRGL